MLAQKLFSKIRICIQCSEITPQGFINISDEDRKYLFNVLRCSPGDLITVIDGKGKSFKVKIINKKTLHILYEENSNTEDSFTIVLCQALLKGEKMDIVIEKATELGVKKIIPFVSERCIVKYTYKLERWRKIAKEATEQSGRTIIPQINNVIQFYDLIKSVENGILFWEKETQPLIHVVSGIDLEKPIFLLIGPEGGFTSNEVNEAEKRGIETASLGKRVLKAETASIVSVAIISFLVSNPKHFRL